MSQDHRKISNDINYDYDNRNHYVVVKLDLDKIEIQVREIFNF
jgi:hypothetical protein